MTMAYELLGIFLEVSPCSVRFATWFQASRSGLMLLRNNIIMTMTTKIIWS